MDVTKHFVEYFKARLHCSSLHCSVLGLAQLPGFRLLLLGFTTFPYSSKTYAYSTVPHGHYNTQDKLKQITSHVLTELAYPSFLQAVSYLPLAAQKELVGLFAGRGVEYLRRILTSLHQLITIRIVSQSDHWSSTNLLNNDSQITGAAKVGTHHLSLELTNLVSLNYSELYIWVCIAAD